MALGFYGEIVSLDTSLLSGYGVEWITMDGSVAHIVRLAL